MHPDDAVTFLLRSLEGAKDAAARCGALDALRHLVPRLAAGLRGREQAVRGHVIRKAIAAPPYLTLHAHARYRSSPACLFSSSMVNGEFASH